MIEVIYNGEDTESAGGAPSLKLPKNVRQIGEIGSEKKIYIEDYVVTWLHGLVGGDDVVPRAAVLLGEVRAQEGIRCFFINGALELDDITIAGDGITIGDEEWTSVYGRMKQYFDTKQIVGWFLGVNGFSLHITADILKAHIDNFSGNDKLFMMYENEEKEDGFFLFENGELVRQPGFYIYFEKNSEMQNYMVERNQGKSVEGEAGLPDAAVREFRSVIRDRKEEQEQKKILPFLYAASTFLVMIVLVMGITMVNNYDKMRDMEASLQVISDTVVSQNKNDAAESSSGEGTGSGEASEDAKNGDESGESGSDDTSPDDSEKSGAGSAEAVAGKAQTTYIVKRGDTLTSISRKIYGNNGMVDEIVAANSLENGDKIYSGQKLILP